MRLTTDVAIVGGGPVGVTIANLLGRYGVDTVLVERETDVVDYPRAVGIDDEGLRTLQAAGLADLVLAGAIQNVPLRFYDARGRCLAEVSPSSREFGWYRRNVFMQPLAERTLRAGLARFPHVRALFGHEHVGLDQHPAGARLELRRDDGAAVEVEARFVVAADGGRSTVRDQLGVRLAGDTHPRKWVVVDCANDPLDAPYTALHCDPRRPYVCAHMPFDFRRWEFMLFPGEDAEEMLAPAKVRELLRHHVPDPAAIDVVRARVYTHHSRIAERFVVGRVALAGDAAHLMPPWAGQGLNTGLRDAFNLAWKLAAITRGAAAPSLLTSYEQERRAHAQAMIDLSTTLGRILSATRALAARSRDAAFRAVAIAPGVRSWILEMRFKPQPAYPSGAFVTDPGRARRRHQPVGRMFIQPTVETGAGTCVRLDDVLGTGFAVVGFECDPTEHLDEAGAAALRELDPTVLRVVESRAGDVHRLRPHTWPGTTLVEDVENLLRPWFHRHEANVVVLRPDRYVAALCDARDLSGALVGLRALLGRAPTRADSEET